MLRLAVKRNVAEPGPGIVAIIEAHFGEERHCACFAVDFVNRAGRTVLIQAELARHPFGAGSAVDQALEFAVGTLLDDLQSEHRRRCCVDIGCL